MTALTAPEIILRPVVSEKSIDESGRGKYTFAVHDRANKIQIKAAVESTFNVRVKAVNTLNVKRKVRSRVASRRGGRIIGHEAAWKKAIVTLQPGERIDLFEQV